MGDIVNPDKSSQDESGASYSIAYFLGSHIFIFIGLVFLRLAYRLSKKIKDLEENNEIKKAIDQLGS